MTGPAARSGATSTARRPHGTPPRSGTPPRPDPAAGHHPGRVLRGLRASAADAAVAQSPRQAYPDSGAQDATGDEGRLPGCIA